MAHYQVECGRDKLMIIHDAAWTDMAFAEQRRPMPQTELRGAVI
jgi:hypothetical protein